MQCEICGKEYENICNHILQKHKISIKDYYDTYIKKENEGYCRYCGQRADFISFAKGYKNTCLKCRQLKKIEKEILETNKQKENLKECKICSKKVINLGKHVAQAHKNQMTSKEYYDKYLKKENEGICPICGKPTTFVNLNVGYKECCSVSCAAKNPKRQEKIKSTNLKKHGVINTFLIPETFEKAQKNSHTPEAISKMLKTKKDKFGYEGSFENKEILQKAITNSHTPEAELKREQSVYDQYGVKNALQIPEVHNKGIKSASSPEIRKKAKDTMFKNHGITGTLQLKENQIKAREGFIDKHGDTYAFHSDDAKMKAHSPESYKKRYTTSRQNGNQSSFEDYFEDKCKDNNIEYFVQGEKSDERYPFPYDFYLPEKDIFIEIQGNWNHGGHWFNSSSEKDNEELNSWKSKTTPYYISAVETWSIRDVNKREVAKQNNINYVVLWNKDDIDLWFSLDCPIGKDWIKEYSWLPNRKLDNDLTFRNLSSGSKNCIMITKVAVFNEFYKRELLLWNNNDYEKSGTLQSNLYCNRLKYLNKNPNQLTNLEILRGLNISGKIRAYSTFDNSGFKEFLDKYTIKSVYDPCAGWGERLVTCAAKNIKYFGVDINKNVIDCHKKIINHYNLIDQITICEDSSNYINDQSFDCTFTCPPYWNEEIYTEVGSENLSYKDFLNWWKKVIFNSNTDLFAYQINQKYKDDMNNILIECGFVKIDEINLNSKSSHFTRKSGENTKTEYETIQIFKRGIDIE